MFYFLEIIFILFVILFFIYREKPKIRFLFYGSLFFLISLLIQIPFKLFELRLIENLGFFSFSVYLVISISVIISELIKYFSLNKYLSKTRSLKNGILFILVWISLESLTFFTVTFYTFLFSLISIDFNYAFLLSEEISFFNFIYFFFINVAVSILVLHSVIKKNILYLFSAIFFSLIIYINLHILSGLEEYLFIFFSLFFSMILLFYYKKIIK
jgi:hypothetical protein